MQLPKPSCMRINLWLENEYGILFGLGRYTLLKQVEQCGSLKTAAQNLGMSYRAAWGKMKQAEEILGKALIEKHGSNRRGYQLTLFGKKLMERYEQWLNKVEEFALTEAHLLLDRGITKFKL